MTWAAKRQLMYLSGVFAVFALIVFWIISPMIFKSPTCIDSKQNGTETGIDCGGTCSNICRAETSSPVIIWSRAFPITGNMYNLVAYVENPNKKAAIANVDYEFKVFDTDNILMGVRKGNTFIPPNKQFVIFEPQFNSGKSQIKSISFNFTSPFVWQKKESTLNTLPIKVDNIVFKNNFDSSILTARVNNDSVYNIPAFDVVAILYDRDDNAINVSKTRKDGLNSNNSTPIAFTWPKSLSKTPVKRDILIQINPFNLSFLK